MRKLMVEEAREGLARLVDEIVDTGEPALIERADGRAVAVVPLQVYEALQRRAAAEPVVARPAAPVMPEQALGESLRTPEWPTPPSAGGPPRMAGPTASPPVCLRHVADLAGSVPDTWTVHVDRVTGEVVTLGSDLDGLDDMAADRERVEGSRDFVAMPSRYDLDEYRIMARFAESHPEPAIGNALSRAISGKGAFRRFKDTTHRLGVSKQWYAWRDRAIARIVADRLESEGIDFVDDVGLDADR